MAGYTVLGCEYQCDCQECYYRGHRCKHSEHKGEYCSEVRLNGECPEGISYEEEAK